MKFTYLFFLLIALLFGMNAQASEVTSFDQKVKIDVDIDDTEKAIEIDSFEIDNDLLVHNIEHQIIFTNNIIGGNENNIDMFMANQKGGYRVILIPIVYKSNQTIIGHYDKKS